jgi:hypothetical protein
MLALIVSSLMLTIFGVSFSVGLLSSSRTRADDDAASTWRAIVHRNAISEPIPFAQSVARVNAPGLVQVYPRSQPPTPTEPAPTALPAPVSLGNPPVASVSPTSAAPQLPIELADEATDEEREIVLRLWEKGRSMSAIILSVWGIKSGGSQRYAQARARYKFYLAEARSS